MRGDHRGKVAFWHRIIELRLKFTLKLCESQRGEIIHYCRPSWRQRSDITWPASFSENKPWIKNNTSIYPRHTTLEAMFRIANTAVFCAYRQVQPRWRLAIRFLSTKKTHDPLRILFCGSDEYSIASLRALHAEHKQRPDRVASIDVVCRPGKRVGRGLKQIREGNSCSAMYLSDGS